MKISAAATPTSQDALILDTARRAIAHEIAALESLLPTLGGAFAKTCRTLAAARGRLIVAGVGKSALVAQKVAATLTSTGTPAHFLHASDALHGDVGVVQDGDHALLFSRSGETAEVLALARVLVRDGRPFTAVTARPDATLARLADATLLTPHAREADAHDLAPTASTTAQMALGDALAAALSALRDFRPADFARLHPHGALGTRLTLTLGQLAARNERPRVLAKAPLQDVVVEMTGKRLGATAVVDERDHIIGLITDGDLRRALGSGRSVLRLTAKQLMTPAPRTLRPDRLATEGLALLRRHDFNHVVLAEEDGAYVGLVHLHDFVREGLE